MIPLLVIGYIYVGLCVAVLAERQGFKMDTMFHQIVAIATWPILQFLMLLCLILTDE